MKGEAHTFRRNQELCAKRCGGVRLRWIENGGAESDDAASPITRVENEKQQKGAQERENEVTEGHERPH